PGFANQTNATAFRVPGASPKAERRECREPDHFEIWILKRDTDRIRVHPQTRSRSAVDLDAMREFPLLDEIINMALREECRVGAHVPVILERKRAHAGLGGVDRNLNHVLRPLNGMRIGM